MKLVKYLFKNNTFKALFILILIFSNLFLEMLSIALFIPFITILVDKNFDKLNFIEEYHLDFFLRNDNFDILNIFLILIFFIFLIKNIFLLFSNFYQNKFFEKLQIKLSETLFKSYLNKNYLFFTENNTANLIRNLRAEANSSVIYIQSCINLFSELIIIFGIITLLFLTNYKITFILIFILIPCLLVFYLLTKNYISILGKRRAAFDGSINKDIIEGLGAIREIKIYGKELLFHKNFLENLKKFSNVSIYYNLINFTPRVLLELLLILCILIMIFFLNSNLISYSQPIITLVGLFGVASIRMLPSTIKIMTNIQTIKFRANSLKIISNELENLNEGFRYEKNRENQNISKFDFDFKNDFKVEFKDISFSYPNSNEIIFNNISIELKKNSFYGIYGSSGSGKSTFVDLLSGFLLPTNGNISLNNQDIRNNSGLWKKKIGYVSQKTFLFDDTIQNNITFGEKIFNKKKLEEIIHNAGLADLVYNKLIDGLNTVVGENGAKLSGGQIQRIGIARALFSDPLILIFDEATNALDNNAEDRILKTISNISENKITTLISHDLNSLRFCDKLIEIRNKNCYFVK